MWVNPCVGANLFAPYVSVELGYYIIQRDVMAKTVEWHKSALSINYILSHRVFVKSMDLWRCLVNWNSQLIRN